MILYEFTFSDNTNLNESDVLALVTESLKEEALLQNWAPGYNFRQCQKPKQTVDGSVEYYFEVEGEYLVGGESGDAQDQNQPKNTRSDLAASP
jgi:hypothetical protein